MLENLPNIDEQSMFYGIGIVLSVLLVFEIIALIESVVMYYASYKKIYKIHKALKVYVKYYNLSKTLDTDKFRAELHAFSKIVVLDFLDYFGYRLNNDGTYSRKESLLTRILRRFKKKSSK